MSENRTYRMASSSQTKLSIFLNVSFLLFLGIYLVTRLSDDPDSSLRTSTGTQSQYISEPPEQNPQACASVHDNLDQSSKCRYVRSQPECKHKGYINYLEIFYCTFGNSPFSGQAILLLWLTILFYLLGNTAAEYFCPSLESLSKIMKLSPTIAGVTLLSLGNGASDVFASIVSFTRTGSGNVGLNSVLGGAFFVSSVVVGVISITISSRQVAVDRASFIRDILFFVFSLVSLLMIIFIKRIGLLGSVCFVSIYFIYVCTVSAMHLLPGKPRKSNLTSAGQDCLEEIGVPLLGYAGEEEKYCAVLIENGRSMVLNDLQLQEHSQCIDSSACSCFVKMISVFELPLQLPRRLTIPMAIDNKWSKPYAVISVSLAPVLLAALCNSQRDNVSFQESTMTFLISGLIGMVLGNIAFATTKKWNPPKSGLSLWLSAGFLMSVTWTYIIAEELVSLLISMGIIFGISSSVLGLTVLAWGNSLGDLIANTAMAINGGPDGVQIAISGCYAGPMFNTLMGLGLSLVFESWSKYPLPFEVPADDSVYETIGFFIGGLLWALVIIPRNNMRLDRSLGFGLLAIYLCFLSLRVARTVGLLNP